MPYPRYAPWIRHLHWLVFGLVVVALALIYLHGWAPKDSSLRANLKWAHMQFGIVILLLMVPRLWVRASNFVPPPIQPPIPRWQDVSAKLVHVVLYGLLVAVPMLGITNRMWDPGAWNVLGIPMPHVAHPDKPTAKQIKGIHETLGNGLMYLAALHAIAALGHHFIQRDNTLRRMLPARRHGKGKSDPE